MPSLSKAQLISLVVAPMMTGSISFIASSIILTMVYRSSLKLSTIYRRLICGISVFDLIQSLASLTSSLPMPAGYPVWGAIGNDVTCGIQGFISVIGILGSVFYSLSLSIYFLCVTKFSMSEKQIKEKIEPFLHIFPIAYAFCGGIFIYVTHNYGPSGEQCWIAPEPVNCNLDPDVECTSKGDPNVIISVFAAVPVFFCFCASIVIMVLIWRAHHAQTMRNQAYRTGWRQGTNQGAHAQSQNDTSSSLLRRISTWSLSLLSFNKADQQQHQAQQGALDAYLSSRPPSAAMRRSKEIRNRALAFTIGYFLTYVFSATYRIWEMNGSTAPFVITLLGRIFIPLQGLFNILIYTYPHVTSYRCNHPEHSWFRSFREVIKSGGDSDRITGIRRGRNIRKRRGSVRKEPIVQDNDELVVAKESERVRLQYANEDIILDVP